MTDVTKKGYTTVSILLKYENHAIGSYLGTYDIIDTYHPSQSLEICGILGRVKIEDFVGSYSFQKMGSDTEEIWRPGMITKKDRYALSNFGPYIDAVIQNLREKKASPISAECGYRTLYLAYKMIESYETGKRTSMYF
jgi:myo-inositol 2-dehydrogenase/D-chiro-inositol 1-dehydrogenase